MSTPPHFARLVVDRDDEFDPHDWLPPLDRRAAQRMLSLSAVAALTGCGAGGTVSGGGSVAGTTASTTTLKASAASTTTGTSVTLTATVSPSAAAGTVTFYNGSTSLGTATLSGGNASLSTSFSTAGTETLQAIYGGSSTYAGSTSGTVTVTVTGATTSSCATQTLEGEEGPYFVNDSATGYNRSNILTNLDGTESQAGVPFALTLYVYDAKNSCAAMQNVQIDIWHCSATGLYSAESSEGTSTKTWLRGYQLTDANGMVQFQTIIPGWYQGRTTHIHLRLRSTYDSSSSGGTNTMQLFFDQSLVDTLYTSVSPYSSKGKNTTTNAADRVYTQQEQGTTLMTLSGSNSAGYSATAKVYLPIK